MLVDRLQPRGLTKQKAHSDQWLKAVPPSDRLRRRVHADPEKWDEFLTAYGRELEREPAKTAAASLRERLRHGPVTLLSAACDEHHKKDQSRSRCCAQQAQFVSELSWTDTDKIDRRILIERARQLEEARG